MKMKFCGIRRLEDIVMMNEFLPDYIGFIFAKSKRQITTETAESLSEQLDKRIKTVGVFVDEAIENVANTVKVVGLNAVQLHGIEDKDYIKHLRAKIPQTEIWKAVRVLTAEDILNAEKLGADRLLLDSFSADAHGGTGKIANLSAIKSANIQSNFFLAGGLNSENIADIIQIINPYGADISSGIETDGFKNRDKILEIMRCLECQR